MKIIIIILQAILNLVRKRRDLIANTDKIPPAIKKSIIAWYSPKKQKLTNYDVIESYADDFTKWRIENTGVTSTQKKIVIAAGTELKYNVAYKGFGNSIAEFDIKYTGNAVIRYRYNKEDGTTDIITIDKSGIYHLPASVRTQKNFGFYCNPQTVTEETTIEQLPTSILKDFSGNGNHAYLYGGKGKLNSGMGVYQQDFSNVRGVTTVSANGFELFRKGTGGTYLARISIGYWNNKECRLLFETNNTSNLYYIRYRKANNDIVTSVRLHNGENIIPAQDDLADVSEVIFEGALRDNEYIRVTEIPDCSDQLCYDGKMYAVCYDFPILTDYTVMADRTWFENKNIFLAKGNITTEAKYAFIFERFKPDGVMAVQSFGAWNDVVSTTDSCISYLTKNKYNGIDIRSGIGADDDMLSIGGALNKGNIELTSVCCHGDILVFNRSLTEYEISWVKNNLMGSKPQRCC